MMLAVLLTGRIRTVSLSVGRRAGLIRWLILFVALTFSLTLFRILFLVLLLTIFLIHVAARHTLTCAGTLSDALNVALSTLTGAQTNWTDRSIAGRFVQLDGGDLRWIHSLDDT